MYDKYKDKEKRKNYLKEYRVKNGNRDFNKWLEKNGEKYKQYKKKWYKRNAEYIKNKRDELREVILQHYGNKCNCSKCPETNPLFLTIDHVNNDGYKTRKDDRGYGFYKKIIKENFPDKYQLLCYNCNCGRSKYGGICPHTHN